MTALAILLGTAIVGALVLIAWLVYGRVAAADQAADARVAQVATEAELERAQFELEQRTQALAASERREDILQEAVADALDADPGAGLSHDDVLGRIMRLSAEWARSDRAGREVPAEPHEAVPSDPPAGAPEALMRPGE